MPNQDKQDHLLDHNYDGIQEFDNDLPRWWLYGFYLTIAIAFVYFVNFHVLRTPLVGAASIAVHRRVGAKRLHVELTRIVGAIKANLPTVARDARGSRAEGLAGHGGERTSGPSARRAVFGASVRGARDEFAVAVPDIESPALREAVEALELATKRGLPLNKAMRAHPRIFDRVYTEIIAAGEHAGTLERMLDPLATGLVTAEKIRSKVARAMIQPMFQVKLVKQANGKWQPRVISRIKGQFVAPPEPR